jgi:hypothetical protein
VAVVLAFPRGIIGYLVGRLPAAEGL